MIPDGKALYLSETDSTGHTVTSFFHFQEATSQFGSVSVCKVEKKGLEVPKSSFSLQKNNLLSKWSQVKLLMDEFQRYEHSSDDVVKKVITDLESLPDAYKIPQFCFLLSQVRLMLMHKNNRKFTTQTMIFALQMHNISPACYKAILRSDYLVLPSVKRVKDMLRKSVQDTNLVNMFQSLTPQQRVVNIYFDEVKLVETLRFSGGQVQGYARNIDDGVQSETLASHALVVQIACHSGGPKYILRVIPCKKMQSDQLRNIVIEAGAAVVKSGGTVLCYVADNCNTNRSVYSKLGGPGKVAIPEVQHEPIFLIYDFVHIFKNLRNNWILLCDKKITFVHEGTEMSADWHDIQKVYEADKQTQLKLTKLTNTAVYPKPLERQSVPLVRQVRMRMFSMFLLVPTLLVVFNFLVTFGVLFQLLDS